MSISKSQIASVGASLLLAACGSSVGSTSMLPSAEVTASSVPSVAGSETQATATPSSTSPLVLAPLRVAEVVVERLAVRQGPGTSRPLMPGYRRDASGEPTELVAGGVRLGSGYYVLVEAGPLVLDDGWWYRVQNLQLPSQDAIDLLWDIEGDGFPDSGWVAGAVLGAIYIVSVEETPSPSDGLPYPSVLDPYWVMHGVGSARSTVVDFPELDEGVWNPIGVTWYAADPAGQECEMKVTMQPDGWDMGSTSIHDWGDGGGVTPAPPAVLVGHKWLEVESDCSWTLVAIATQG